MSASVGQTPSDPIPATFMEAALRLAQRGLGAVWPNPAVGCVIVRFQGGVPVVLARGWTQSGGRPHAEAVALEDLYRRHGRGAAKGADVYVSLEPCSHHGRTPPCVDALIEAGVGRVIVACVDPDPRVSGRGIERLRAAGIEVVLGTCREAAEHVNAGFFHRVAHGRPLVTLKTATSLDGRIATASGDSQWITGDTARAHVHLERARHDAVMVGVATAIHDDPRLTCRLPGLAGRSPVRVVLDTHLRLPLTARLVAEAPEAPTWLVTRPDNDRQRVRAYQHLGVQILEVAPHANRLDIADVLRELADRGITRLLVEGGAHVTATLLADGFVDRILWYRAPKLIGGDGLSATVPFGLNDLAEAPRFVRVDLRHFGDDRLETYERLT